MGVLIFIIGPIFTAASGFMWGWFFHLFLLICLSIIESVIKRDIKIPYINKHTPFVNEGEESKEFAFRFGGCGAILGLLLGIYFFWF
jgi:hypothetical protein